MLHERMATTAATGVSDVVTTTCDGRATLKAAQGQQRTAVPFDQDPRRADACRGSLLKIVKVRPRNTPSVDLPETKTRGRLFTVEDKHAIKTVSGRPQEACRNQIPQDPSNTEPGSSLRAGGSSAGRKIPLEFVGRSSEASQGQRLVRVG